LNPFFEAEAAIVAIIAAATATTPTAAASRPDVASITPVAAAASAANDDSEGTAASAGALGPGLCRAFSSLGSILTKTQQTAQDHAADAEVFGSDNAAVSQVRPLVAAGLRLVAVGAANMFLRLGCLPSFIVRMAGGDDDHRVMLPATSREFVATGHHEASPRSRLISRSGTIVRPAIFFAWISPRSIARYVPRTDVPRIRAATFTV
jgi:hypothetical protein